jgi:hypothetical protein
MKLRLSLPPLFIFAAALSLCAAHGRAQSLSPSLSDPLAEQSETTGLNTNFDQGAQLGVTVTQGILDATGSDLNTSSMSALVNSSLQVRPTAASSSADAGHAGGAREGQGGAWSVAGFGISGFSGAAVSDGDGFGRGAGLSAFRANTMNHATAGGQHGALPDTPASTGKVASGSGYAGSEVSGSGLGNGYSETASSSDSTPVDPVLATVRGSDSMLGGPILIAASPQAEASEFFSSPDPVPPSYQFDDGVTAQLLTATVPGRILPNRTTYAAPLNGFPDSTLGQAALPSAASEAQSPLERAASGTDIFPAVSDGKVFGLHTGIVPNLFTVPHTRTDAAFRGLQDRLFELRIMNGMDVTDAETKRSQALAQHQMKGSDHGVDDGKTPGRNANALGRSTVNDSPSETSIR